MRHPGIMLLNPESNVLGEANVTPPFRILEDVNAISCRHPAENWLRGLDLNQRPSGYEPDELPGCSTPRLHYVNTGHQIKLKMLFAATISPIQELALAVGFGGSFPYICRDVSSVYLGNQANSDTARPNYFTAVCWQFCWQWRRPIDLVALVED